jgi:hypothetical protein
LISVAGASDVSIGSATINIIPAMGITTGSYTVLQAAGGVSPISSTLPWSVTGLRPGSSTSVTTTANQVLLNVASIASANINWAGTTDGATVSAT